MSLYLKIRGIQYLAWLLNLGKTKKSYFNNCFPQKTIFAMVISMPLLTYNIVNLMILDFPSLGGCEEASSGSSLLWPHRFPTPVKWSSFSSTLEVETAVLQATACVLPAPQRLCSHFCCFRTTHLIPQTTTQANIFLSPHFSLISHPTCLLQGGEMTPQSTAVTQPRLHLLLYQHTPL